jgi:hypothetical protein
VLPSQLPKPAAQRSMVQTPGSQSGVARGNAQLRPQAPQFVGSTPLRVGDEPYDPPLGLERRFPRCVTFLGGGAKVVSAAVGFDGDLQFGNGEIDTSDERAITTRDDELTQ